MVSGQRAGLPMAEWLGVERIVVACDGPAAGDDRLCRSLVDEARRQSAYPIVAGQAGEIAGRHDLVLHVSAQIPPGADRGRSLSLTLRLVRPMLRVESEAAPPRALVVPSDPAGMAAAVGPVLATMLKPPAAPVRPRRGIPTPPRS